jgi:hypothetical protein
MWNAMEWIRHRCGRLAVVAIAAAPLAAFALAPAARAQTPLFDELRLGLMAHTIEPDHSEGGADVNIELLFRRPATSYGNAFADFVFRPRVHVGASINTIGDTSQIYAGLTWDFKLAERLSLEVSFGGAWHDGPLNGGAADLYGCSLNFRESVSLGYALSEAWTVYGTLAHMSNADLCSNNSGITSAGVRIGYKLK